MALRAILDRLADLEVLVVGEAILDSYLRGTSDRLCPEAPVPIVSVAERRDVPGGAANTALNVAGLGATAHLTSVVGDDAEGAEVARLVKAGGVSTGAVLRDPARRTLAKHRVVADDQMVVRFDHGTTDPISPATERRLLEVLEERSSGADAIVLSDYGYGVLSPAVIEAVARLARHGPLVVDAKDPRRYAAVGPTVVKPNYREAVRLLGEREVEGADARAEQMEARAEHLLQILRSDLVTVTLDSAGALLLERDRPPYRTYARHVSRARAAGAGDTFVAALALALAAGGDPTEAMEIATAAAGVVVGKEGTASCSRAELLERFRGEDKVVPDAAALRGRVEFHRAQGERVVFTNGCFDILHRGHISYLNRAKEQGDVLVVAVNGDASVRRLKGPRRPINSLEDRMEVLAALSCIDYIVSFEEDRPDRLIEVVRPDVFVKGGDYRRETLPEAELVEALGGSVRILPYVEDQSTTGIIERIRAAVDEEAGVREATGG
ncbi:MAG TPA: D-glycero-beta-D-manno-heptose 1-phosphate adenylyltransferase [Actinomycetota bacterium]|nr:D-glycero-beta-D-manno-heptose 1-phosphate adenylyltransferase [Actinomycetota bacterium]